MRSTKINSCISVLILILFTSCKIDNKTNKDLNPNENKEPLVESKVKVIIEAIVPKDDVFQIHYTEDGTAVCSEEMSVKTKVKGSNVSQKIVFNIPEELVIKYLRVDFGENKDQGTMIMNGFTYEYFGKKFETKGSVFFQYFNPTEQIAVDYPKSTITPTGKGSMYDPIFYPMMEKLGPELDKVLK